jgi:hypothetical protein
MDIGKSLEIVGEVSGAIDHTQRANTFIINEAAKQAALELPLPVTNQEPIALALR